MNPENLLLGFLPSRLRILPSCLVGHCFLFLHFVLGIASYHLIVAASGVVHPTAKLAEHVLIE